ncbi:MAG: stage II sporulation protein M [Methanocella sp.]
MDKINRYGNNFDFLRLAGAVLVIFFTAYGVLGAGLQDPLSQLTNGGLNTGSLGVAIFFIISGYLITQSWDKRRNVQRFLWARFLRQVPALAGVALFTVFIIGPLTTHQSLLDYFTSGLTWGYFRIVSIFFPTYSLPGVFTHNFSDRVNGALWTLPIESAMYIIILIAGIAGVLNKKRLATLLTLSVLGFYLYVNIHVMHVIIPLASHDFIELLRYFLYNLSPFNPLCFLMGSVFYLNRDRIKFDFRMVLLAALFWVLSVWSYDLLLLTSLICLPYVVLGIAFKSIPFLGTIGKRGDISYGLYIYHYPVQQMLVNFFGFSPLKLFFATLLITVPLAWLSWHLIEHRALSLKNIDHKIFKADIPGALARPIKALTGNSDSKSVKPRAGPSKVVAKGKLTLLQKVSRGTNHFFAYLYEIRAAIAIVVVLYVAFSAVGFAMGVNYQSPASATTASSTSGTSPLSNIMPAGLALGIIVSNVINCFVTMVLGTLLGIIPLVSTVTGGMAMGWFAGIAMQKSCLCYIMAGGLPRGLFEIPAMLLSSAIGLKLGYSLVMSLAGKKGLIDDIKKSVRAFVFWILPGIFIAALLETLFTFPLLACISGGI